MSLLERYDQNRQAVLGFVDMNGLKFYSVDYSYIVPFVMMISVLLLQCPKERYTIGGLVKGFPI